MHNLSETSTFTPDVPVPDDGVDYRTADSLYAAFQALANRSKWLKNLLTGVVTVQPVWFRSNLDVDGALEVGDTADFAGLATFNVGAIMNGATCVGNMVVTTLLTTLALQVNGSANVAGSVVVNGPLVAKGNCNIGDTSSDLLNFYGTTTLIGDTTSNGALVTVGPFNVAGGGEISSPVACSGNGRVRRPAVIGASSGGGTMSADAANFYYFPTVSADENYTLASSDDEGDEIEVLSQSSTHSVKLYQPGGVTLIVTLLKDPSYPNKVRLKKISGAYVLVSSEQLP